MAFVGTSSLKVTPNLNGKINDSKITVSTGALAVGSSSSIKPVSDSNSAGTANAFARADHKHEGVHSLQADAGPSFVGDVKLSSGSNITLTTGTNSIVINATVPPPVPVANLHAKHSSPQSIPDSTQTLVAFDTVDSQSSVNYASNIATPTVAGWYRVRAFVTFSDTGALTGVRRVQIINGGIVMGMSSSVATNQSLLTGFTTVADIKCNGVADTISVFAFQNSGSPLSLETSGGGLTSRLDITFLHP